MRTGELSILEHLKEKWDRLADGILQGVPTGHTCLVFLNEGIHKTLNLDESKNGRRGVYQAGIGLRNRSLDTHEHVHYSCCNCLYISTP